jgi:hypothetical protein
MVSVDVAFRVTRAIAINTPERSTPQSDQHPRAITQQSDHSAAIISVVPKIQLEWIDGLKNPHLLA